LGLEVRPHRLRLSRKDLRTSCLAVAYHLDGCRAAGHERSLVGRMIERDAHWNTLLGSYLRLAWLGPS
jgi:hypothetical protein